MNRPALEPRLQCALCAGFDCETAIPFPDIPVLRCRTCGFLYSGRVMPEKILAGYYANDFASRRHLLGQRLNAAMNFSVLRKILNPPRGISVLDAGCGYGFLLRLLRDKWQADVTGVEVSKRGAFHARETLGLAKIYPSPDEIPSDQLFDLVTCLEVIEHIREPVPFARELLKRVAPGGCLVVMTDNFGSSASCGMGCAFPKWIPHSHISHFTPETLEKCLNRAGAEKVSFHSHTPWEMLALAAKSRLSAARPPSACFCLDDVLATEMNRPFRLFTLRKNSEQILAASLFEAGQKRIAPLCGRPPIPSMISVLILTLNEEANLPTCLESVKWSDDIVVFDSFSTDRTVEIAEAAGARVIQRAFDNEREHRAASLRAPFKYPWVYNPDADEITSPELREEMSEVVADPARREVAYRVRFKTMFCGRWIRHSSLYPTWFVRLFQPGKISFERSVHLRYLVDGLEGRLQNHFEHRTFNKGIDAWLEKHNRYSSREAVESLESLSLRPFKWTDLSDPSPVLRRRALKELSFRLPFRPLLRFIYMYFFRLGFLDGRPGFDYCLLLSMYEQMIVLKMNELRRKPATSALAS